MNLLGTRSRETTTIKSEVYHTTFFGPIRDIIRYGLMNNVRERDVFFQFVMRALQRDLPVGLVVVGVVSSGGGVSLGLL
jgi:hypothetical protein